MDALADHLWQSTWFAVAAAMLALLARNDARLRYSIWFAASLKFLLPFAALTLLGQQLVWQADEAALLPLVQQVAVPLTSTVIEIEPLGDVALRIVVSIWALGTFVLLLRWLVNHFRARRLIDDSAPCSLAAPIPVRCTSALAEPGVVGIWKPVLLMPRHLLESLSPPQLDCVIAHELWHVRRRDNLTAAMHALVEALFWFHPLVWWIGARLIETREHACDEGALREGVEAQEYAESLLRVCRHSLESREAWIASAAGGDLVARIRTIMKRSRAPRFTTLKQALLAFALAGCVALPVAAGINVITTSQIHVAAGAQSITPTNDSGPAYFAAHDDYVFARNVSLRQLISHAYDIDEYDVKGNLPWLDHPRYNVELRAAPDAPVDHRQLIADLLKRQFNLELIVRPTLGRHEPSGLDF